jgi:hypothetical protein
MGFKTRPAGTVLSGPPVSTPCHTALLPLTPSRNQPLPTGPRCRPVPPVSRLRQCRSCPAPSPVTRQWRRPCLIPPLSSSIFPPRGADPRTPAPFPLCRATRPPPVPLFALFLSFAPVHHASSLISSPSMPLSTDGDREAPNHWLGFPL